MGQPVKVLPASQCEGTYLRPNEMPQALAAFAGADVRVYGTWRRARDLYWPPADYTIVLAIPDAASGELSRELLVSEDALIVGLNFGCGESPSQLVERRRLTERIDEGQTGACKTRVSLDGRLLAAGPAFELAAQARWQLCLGGVAAGSGEKYLFRTADGGATWMLLSRTTLGDPSPEAGVGALPNGNSVVQISFLDASSGWMGLNSAGDNLFRTQDGGVTWSAMTALPPGVAVTSITFSDAQHGTVATAQSDWADGGRRAHLDGDSLDNGALRSPPPVDRTRRRA